MKIILDACSLINLLNCSVFQEVASLSGYEFFIGNLVMEECLSKSDPTHNIFIQLLIQKGSMQLIPLSQMSKSDFENYLKKYNLGDGETECITLSSNANYIICSDDKAARDSIEKEFGRSRLTGSLGLIKETVGEGLISCNIALEKYKIMIEKGGFLPQVASGFFCTL